MSNSSTRINKHRETNVLGKNGAEYSFLLYGVMIIPLALVLLIWYVFFSSTSPASAPLWINLFLGFITVVLLHQAVEILRFLRTASRTAKKITLMDDAIILTLFSNKTVELKSITVSNDADRYTKSVVHKRLFPKGSHNLSVFSGSQEYLISSTTDDFEGLKRMLYERGKSGA